MITDQVPYCTRCKQLVTADDTVFLPHNPASGLTGGLLVHIPCDTIEVIDLVSDRDAGFAWAARLSRENIDLKNQVEDLLNQLERKNLKISELQSELKQIIDHEN